MKIDAAQPECEATAPGELSRLLSVQQESHAFWRMRLRTIRTTLWQAYHNSRLRMSLVVFLSALFWLGLFVLFSGCFRFLNMNTLADAGTHMKTVQAIYNVFFASLMIMLVLSSGIILYSGLYCSGEAGFLLTTPVRPERIVLHKFQEAIFFSSWGFVLLGSPMLIAYGLEAHAPWTYFALLGPFMLSFIYIPCAIGAILCLLIVHRVPRIRMYSLFLAAAAVVLTGAFFAWAFLNTTEGNLLTPLWFHEMLARLKVSEHRLLPSWWLSSGLLEAARNDPSTLEYQPWAESLMYLAVLVSNALFSHLLVMWAGARLYRASYSGLTGEQTVRKPRRAFWLDRMVMRGMPFLTPQMRLLIVKDSRIFRRDPVQWSQFLIFFGLLALYFLNNRRFSYDVNYGPWVNMISFLNLAVVGLILSTFTTRFIFPMISLEGRRFWILGLLPIGRDSILWGKFLFAGVGSCVPCMLLILLSDIMLGISPLVIMIHQLTCFVLCLGLAGIAVGLGAAMPDLHEQSPSKIAAGFGGTLNLVLSAIYIMVVILLTAVPTHFYLQAREHHVNANPWLIGGIGCAVLVGILTTVIPMWIGLRSFRALEF